MTRALVVGLAVASVFLPACSDDGSSSGSDSATGGSVSSTGGANGSGGSQAQTGSGGSGVGQTGSGGASTTGGVPSTGGVTASGGQGTTGGQAPTGGQTATGGQVGSGGSVATGGIPGTGGTGPVAATGGVSPTGGTPGLPPQTGGTAGIGGPGTTGGVENTGGTSEATGGVEDSGGTAGTGDPVENTGGTEVSSGGVENTGGSDVSPGGTPDQGTGGSEAVTCPSTTLASGNSNKTVSVDGQNRSYVLHVPSTYNGSEPVPLILDFHGITGDGPGESTSSPYPAQTDRDGVIMAFPTGASGPMGNAWNVGPCCVANVDDVALARAIVAQIQESACIDPKRVYAVGFSMGGGMSHFLGCRAADLFAAVAPAAFDLLEDNVGECHPERPITVVSFRGTSDPIVPYDGGYSSVVSGMPITFLGAEATFEKWAELNQCTGSPSATDGQGCSTYSECGAGVQVTLCTKQGGGHEAGNASVAWPILKQYTLP